MRQEDVSSKVPRSFVMERGAVGKAVSQLVVDMRQVMEPHTASKLKVSNNRVFVLSRPCGHAVDHVSHDLNEPIK